MPDCSKLYIRTQCQAAQNCQTAAVWGKLAPSAARLLKMPKWGGNWSDRSQAAPKCRQSGK